MTHYIQNFDFVKIYINILNYALHNFKYFPNKDKE
jgi:hypothetical protein